MMWLLMGLAGWIVKCTGLYSLPRFSQMLENWMGTSWLFHCGGVQRQKLYIKKLNLCSTKSICVAFFLGAISFNIHWIFVLCSFAFLIEMSTFEIIGCDEIKTDHLLVIHCISIKLSLHLKLFGQSCAFQVRQCKIPEIYPSRKDWWSSWLRLSAPVMQDFCFSCQHTSNLNLFLFQLEERQIKCPRPVFKLQHLITQDLIKPLLLPEYIRTNGCTILGCIRKYASILCRTFNHESWESLQDATRPAS